MRALCFAQASFVLLAAMACLVAAAQAEEATHRLKEVPVADSLERVTFELESKGQLKLNASGKQVTYLPLVVKANHEFAQRTLAQANAVRLARYYTAARAAMRIGETDSTTELAAERRLIVLEGGREGAPLTSPLGPLTREELELLEVPADVAALAGLLPPNAVKEGESWQPASEAVARFLRIDVALQNDVKATLRSVDANLARIEFGGTVDGSIEGVSTRFELAGKLQFHRAQQRITWLGLAMKENRAIGHAAPGYEIATTLRLTRAALETSPELNDEALADLPAEPSPAALLLSFETGQAHYRALLDRNWRVMVDRPEMSVLRYVQQGDLVAQCSLTPLPALAAGKNLSLETFQDDVKAALGTNFGEFTEAATSTTSTGLKVHRVVAVGVASNLPIQWIYLHVLGAEGRRMAVVITLERKHVERFAAGDDSLVGTLEFMPQPAAQTAAQPPAKQPANSAATNPVPGKAVGEQSQREPEVRR